MYKIRGKGADTNLARNHIHLEEANSSIKKYVRNDNPKQITSS